MRRESPGRPVALAFLELMTPNLAAGVAELVEQGCTAVTVVPLFLGAGGHVRCDLPVLLEAARRSGRRSRSTARPPSANSTP